MMMWLCGWWHLSFMTGATVCIDASWRARRSWGRGSWGSWGSSLYRPFLVGVFEEWFLWMCRTRFKTPIVRIQRFHACRRHGKPHGKIGENGNGFGPGFLWHRRRQDHLRCESRALRWKPLTCGGRGANCH